MRALLATLAFCFGCAAGSTQLARFEFQEPQMGLPFRIVLYANDETQAKTAAAAAFARIAELNSILSDYEDNSELTRLSKSSGHGEPLTLSSDLWEVLTQAQALSQRTAGAFDITVGPSVQLWRRARRQRALPAAERIAEELARTGYQHVKLEPTRRMALLALPGMRLDLGGIAKGYAVDEALRVLRQQGVQCGLVSGGGDLAVSAPPPNSAGWRVDIAPLNSPGAPPGEQAVLVEAALATSGDVFQRLLLDGRRYSHIVDPRTGIGLTNSSLVTVIATNCMSADSLATAVSVLGPIEGLNLIERTPGAEVRIVYPDGDHIRLKESSGWSRNDGPAGAGPSDDGF